MTRPRSRNPSSQPLSADTAAVTGGECVLTTATNNQNGSLILPKLGADSPGSFTAGFDYLVGGGSGADGTSFNSSSRASGLRSSRPRLFLLRA